MKRQDFRKKVDELSEEYLTYRYVILAVAAVLPAVLYTEYFLISILLVLTGVTSIAISRLEMNRSGVELVTFTAIFSGYVLGPESGAIIGFIAVLLQMFSGRPPGIYMLWVVPSFTVAGYVAGTVSMPLTRMGVVFPLVLQSFFMFTTFILMREKLPKYLQYAVFNIAFNYVLFQAIAQPLLGLV